MAAAVEALLAADKPVLHVGQGVHWAQAWEELREFAELVQVPVVTTLAGKSAFPEDHPLAAGTLANTSADPAIQLLDEADLVFGIGASFSKMPLSTPIPAGKVLVQQTIDPSDLNKEYAVDHTLLGDAQLVLRQLSAAVKEQLGADGRRAQTDAAATVGQLKADWLAKWQPHLTSDDVPMSSYRVIWDLMHSVDLTQTIVTHDSGNPRDAIAPFWQSEIPRGYLGWGKSTQLGYGLPLVLGAKLAAPEKLAIHFLGDGAFGMCGLDYETAVRERIPILACSSITAPSVATRNPCPTRPRSIGPSTSPGTTRRWPRAWALTPSEWSSRRTSSRHPACAVRHCRWPAGALGVHHPRGVQLLRPRRLTSG